MQSRIVGIFQWHTDFDHGKILIVNAQECLPGSDFNYNIYVRLVLVHLGERLPRHLKANITYLNEKFPQISITIIVDNEKLANGTHNRGANFFLYKRAQGVEEAMSLLNHSKAFRAGFWIYSLERLLALSQYHAAHSNEKLLHIENDVLLLPHFPFEALDSLHKVHWCGHSATEDSAAILFSPTAELTEKLAINLLEEVTKNPSLTDMSALLQIRRTRDTEYDIFPSLSKSQRATMFPKSTETNHTFRGTVFDPASLGMWLLGEDPENNLGFSKIYKENLVYSPKSLYITKHSLYLKNGANDMEVVNLHVHCKDVSVFTLSGFELIAKRVKESKKGKALIKFYPDVFLRSLVRLCKSGKLHTVLLYLPIVRKTYSRISKSAHR